MRVEHEHKAALALRREISDKLLETLLDEFVERCEGEVQRNELSRDRMELLTEAMRLMGYTCDDISEDLAVAVDAYQYQPPIEHEVR